jgi:hypothetical protein
MTGPAVFVSTIPCYGERATTLVIHCSQFDYQPQIDDFMRNGLKVQTFDSVAVPGGPQFFDETGLPKFRWAGANWTEFLLKHHDLEEVILIAHAACGWYKSILGVAATSEMLKNRATHDLRDALGIVPKLLPRQKVAVKAFYAEVTPENHIRFIPVL